MKYFLSLIGLILCASIAFAQQNGRPDQPYAGMVGRVSGNVFDAASKLPVEFASVALYKKKSGKLVNGAITNTKGYFKIDNVQPGEYTLAVSFLGYEKNELESVLTSPEKPDLQLGKIFLDPSSTTMSEVNVESEKSMIETKVDKIIYNAEKDVTSKGGDATDLLQKVPTLSVDMDGNVSMRGSSSIKLLVNGKPSGLIAMNMAEALKSIPADQIKSVEVITNPSAKYDAEGAAGIINIITKTKTMQGLTGSLSGSGGTRMNNMNASLNRRRGRLGINAGLGIRAGVKRFGTTDFHRDDTYLGYTRTLDQNGSFVPMRSGGSVNIGADYDFNAFNSIASSVRFGIHNFDRTTSVNSILVDSASWDYKRYSTNPSNDKSIDFSLDYKHSFRKPDEDLSISFLVDDANENNAYTVRQSGNAPSFDLNEKSLNLGKNIESTLQADYSLPIDSFMVLETGAKTILRNIGSDYTYERYNFLTSEFVNDQNRSNASSYIQQVSAAYCVMSFKIKKKYEIKPGLRYEYTDNKGDFSNGGLAVRNAYDNLIPSFAIGRTFSNSNSLRANYSRRLQRPGSSFLNPYVNASDPKNISYGNPYLLPEYTNSYETSYAMFNDIASGSLSLFYRNTEDVIQSITDVNPAGITTTSFSNIGSTNVYGGSFFGSLTLFKIWTSRGNVNIYRLDQNGVYSGASYKTSDWQYNMNINMTFRLPKDISFEAFGNINSPRATLQGKQPSMSMIHMGLNKQIWKKKATLGFKVWQPHMKVIKMTSALKGPQFSQINNTYIPFRSFGFSFSYNFGKMEFKAPRRKKKGINNDDQKGSEGGDF